MLKLLGSYWNSKGQERVKKAPLILASTADFATNLDDNRDGRTDSWHTNITDNDVIIDPYEFPVGKEPGPSQVPSFQVLCHSHNTHISILFLYS
jgi:hypothetical protein